VSELLVCLLVCLCTVGEAGKHVGLGMREVSMNTKCYCCTFLCLAPQHAVSNQKALEDLPMIRRADLENHNRDGGLWIVVDRKVYDVQDFRYVLPL
jgi:cytochrome b involved in lipid metabolism